MKVVAPALIRPKNNAAPSQTTEQHRAVHGKISSTETSIKSDSCACGGGCPKCLGSLGIQAKLKIGAPNDVYEQEADRVAEQVMRMPEPKEKNTPQAKINIDRAKTGLLAGNSEISIQRQETDFDEDEDFLQTKATPGHTPQVTQNIAAKIQNLRGGGLPLPPNQRRFFESRMGHDFNGVRIHTDSKAADTAQSIQAKAFTLGNNIIFNTGQYSDDNQGGIKLLAHELTHVVQQKGGEAPNLQMQRHGRQTRRSSRAERRRLAREDELFRQFTDRHQQEADLVGDLDANFRRLTIHLENLLYEYTDQGVRNSDAVDIYEGWLRQADRYYQALFTAPNPFSSRKLFLWLRGVRNALHGQRLIIRAFREEVPDDQGFQEVDELRTQVGNSAWEIMGLPLIQSGRQQVEGGDLASVETTAPEEESTTTPEEVEMSNTDPIYLRDIQSEMFPDGEGGWRFSDDRLVPILQLFVHAQATRILRNQREEITRKRRNMGREWRQADPEQRTEMLRNVQRAKRTIVEARNLRETLEEDITVAERLGRINAGLPENYSELFGQITEPRGMTGYDAQLLPTADYTRQMVIERYRRFREGGGRGHEALMFVLTNDVVVVERRRQIQAINGYINGVFHRMPYLRHITENNLTVTGNTVENTTERGYQEALTANSEALRAINRLDPFSMAGAVDAALIRIPETIRPTVRQLIEEEQSDEAMMDALEGIGIALGLVAVALIPVVGPGLAFAAGTAWTLHEEASMYFQDTVSDSSVSPEEENLGVARPGDFERWMNRLGPLLDIAFAGGGRMIGSLRRPSQAVMMELRIARAEMEMAEAGIRETGVVTEVVENAGGNVPHMPASAAGSADSIIDDALEAPLSASQGAGTTVDDVLDSPATLGTAGSSHVPPDIPPVQIRRTTEITNALGEPHGFSLLSDGRIIRCSDDCMELALSIRERSLALYAPDETEGMRHISVRLNGEAREIEYAATQLASLTEAERVAAEAALVARTRRLEMEMSDLELAFQQHGTILGSGDEGFFESIEISRSVAYVDEAGTLGTATRIDADSWRIVARVEARANYPRGNYQTPGRSGLYFDEVGPEIGRPLDRLHPTGPDMFHETPNGILTGLASINQGAQRVVERRIREIIEDAAEDVSMISRVTVRRHPSTDFIQSSDYELLAQRINERPVLIHRERIKFESPRVHPDVTEPDITVPWSADNIDEFLEPHAEGAIEEATGRRLRDIRDPASRAMAETLTEEVRDVRTQLRSLLASGNLDPSMRSTINHDIEQLSRSIIRLDEIDLMRYRLEDARRDLSFARDSMAD